MMGRFPWGRAVRSEGTGVRDRRSTWIGVAWSLLLVSSLVVGAMALYLVRRDQERLEMAARAALTEQARLLADRVALEVTATRDALMDHLIVLGPGPSSDLLMRWEGDEPLVRNVFAWQRDGGLVLPDLAHVLGEEERGFVRRYGGLFTGRLKWPAPGAEGISNEQPTPKVASPAAQAGTRMGAGAKRPDQQALQAPPGFQQLPPGNQAWNRADDLRAKTRLYGQDMASAPLVEHWTPWFWENQLFMLGWVENERGWVWGLELEMMTLLSRLINVLPDDVADSYALLDGQGRVMHQSGAGDPATAAAVTVPIGSTLPHWQVSVYAAAGVGAAVESTLVLSSLVVATFVAAILVGGTLLRRQAQAHLLDAQRKTTFVSNVSHELKTPLTTIRMYAELLNEGRVRDQDRRRSYLDTIVAESQRLTRLVNNVLDFSRVEQRSKSYRSEEVDVAATLEEIVQTQRMRLEASGLHLEFETAEKPIVVRTDRDVVEQVVLNTLDNAIKYGAAGGELRIEAEAIPEGALVRILDRGPGVAAPLRERIFDAFYRVDESLTAEQAGSGLGLHIARRLLRDLGGDLLYSARAGGGACFTLRFVSAPEDPV